jgi:hypothetical protein
MYDKQQDIYSRRQENTGEWLLNKKAFVDWLEKDNLHPILWCPGNRMYPIRVLMATFLTLRSGHWQNGYDVCIPTHLHSTI